ncbi:MAG: cation/H(+) antiporter [Alphaproteobacteria bacterium]|nr:cation/H(+) antiporter [Alphaproteobacteria bacterium]HCP01059.1 cation/H(+) antiporter [Rhodospirillaceae bacterium]
MLSNNELLPLAVVALVALSGGIFLTRLKQPAVVGYILAGLVLGPSGFELVENQESIGLLAELGMLLLLFVLGMELSLRAFRQIWKIAVTTVLLQTAGAMGLVWLIGHGPAWPMAAVVLLAFVLALSSTAVAVKMLEDIGELRTRTGRITVGILIAQDLAVVPMILLLDVAAVGSFSIFAAGRVVLSVGLLLGLILFLSRRQRLNIPVLGATEGHKDLTPLLGLVCCFGAATISGLLGLSPAYGAFLAGLTIGNSNLRVGMLEMVMPIQSVLMMVFFLSIGLLIDLSLIWKNLGIIILMLLIVTVGKTAINLSIFAALRLPWGQALLTALILAQVGEFSFLLGNVGLQRNIISIDEFRIILSVTALSLIISPLYMNAIRRLHRAARYQRASIRYVFRVAFGREVDWTRTTIRKVSRVRVRVPLLWGAKRPGRRKARASD